MKRSYRRIMCAGAAFGVLVGLFAVPSVAGVAEVIPPSGNGVWTVDGHGLGHGHGMSQYGARGAARDGLTAAQIIAFYYPHTVLKRLGASTIRVLISDDGGSSTTVGVPAGQTVTLSWSGGSQSISAASASEVRLVQSGSRLTAQKYHGSWSAWGTGTFAAADFASSSGLVRLYQSSGSTVFRGTVGGVISAGTRMTVNRLPLDSYAQGVVPREMPASWESAGVQAQAIAARSYARYAVEHSGTSAYDICDSTSCQVYGGQAHYDSAGSLVYGEVAASNSAVAATANLVATYNGATIFAQFSASNGGWTVAGGQPYLVAEADPYEKDSDDPYLNWEYQVSTSSVAAQYGLSRLTSIVITQRDGHGQWGGRVLAATVNGTYANGTSAAISTSGFDLQDAMGLPHNWFDVVQLPASVPQSVVETDADASALLSWSPPASAGSSPVTGYQLSVAGVTSVTVPGSVRSGRVGGLVNGRAYTASVRAITAVGQGAAATIAVHPKAAPTGIVAVQPGRLFDTRTSGTPVTPSSPLLFAVRGHLSIPTSGVTAVQLAVTLVTPSASGVLRVTTDGWPIPSVSSIAYTQGQTMTAMVSVPLVDNGRIRFTPSAGTMYLVADQMSYSHANGQAVRATAPRLAVNTTAFGSATRTLQLRGTLGPSATGVVLQIAASAKQSAYMQAWSTPGNAPLVSQVSTAGRLSVTTVVLPVASDGSVQLSTNVPSMACQVSVVGSLVPSGTAGSGLVETIPVGAAEDSAAGVGQNVVAGPAVKSVALLAKSPLPSAGVAAVLLHVTTSGSSGNGSLSVFATGSAASRAVSASLVPGWASTETLLVPLGQSGSISLSTNGPQAQVAIDVLGYVTAA